MNNVSIFACLLLLGGTLLTHALPQSSNSQANANPPDQDTVAKPIAVESKDPIPSTELSVSTTESSSSSNDSISTKVITTTVATTSTSTTTLTSTTIAPTTTKSSTSPPNTTPTTPTTVSTTQSTTPLVTTSIIPSSTQAPPPTKTPATSAPEIERRFDGLSFIGGIVFALGFTAIGFVAWKFYKARTERNYHTL